MAKIPYEVLLTLKDDEGFTVEVVDSIWNPIKWLTVKKVLEDGVEESATLASTFSRVDDVDRLIDSFGIDLEPLLLHRLHSR